MSQSESKYLIKANKILEKFSNSIKNNNVEDAFNSLIKLRLLHGKIIYKINKNDSNESLKLNNIYFNISSLYSVINLINEKIIEIELQFNNYISSNNIDISKYKSKLNNLDNLEEKDDDDDTTTDKLTNLLPLFEGEKSSDKRKQDNITNEINKSQQIIQFNESIPSLLLFYNPRCPACVKTKPHWDALTTSFRKTFESDKKNSYLFNIMEINLEDKTNENLASLFQIEYIPTIIMMESSKKPSAKIEKLEGASDKEKLNAFIKSAYNKFTSN